MSDEKTFFMTQDTFLVVKEEFGRINIELSKTKEKLAIAVEALEKIEDPRKMDHKERDEQTTVYCLQNVAHEALSKIRGEG